ncbi:MAG: hypothetical protein KAS66_00285 [Candidatus Omnitrophica bacterium]|nr:hypothetical protein [Candidatus Omnitrophota bacterium]
MTQKGTQHELNLKDEKTFVLPFSGLRFEVRFLTVGDQRAAEKVSRKPGGNPKKPKYDLEKKGQELVFLAMKGWTHEDGGKLVHPGGKEIEVTRDNVNAFILNYPGLGAHIIQRVSNADLMYQTISEEDTKN